MTATAIPSAVITPEMSDGGHISVSISGAPFVTFASTLCKQLTIVNNSGVDIEVQQDAAGANLPIINGTAYPFYGLSNASQLGVRRIDQVATAKTIVAR